MTRGAGAGTGFQVHRGNSARRCFGFALSTSSPLPNRFRVSSLSSFLLPHGQPSSVSLSFIFFTTSPDRFCFPISGSLLLYARASHIILTCILTLERNLLMARAHGIEISSQSLNNYTEEIGETLGDSSEVHRTLWIRDLLSVPVDRRGKAGFKTKDERFLFGNPLEPLLCVRTLGVLTKRRPRDG